MENSIINSLKRLERAGEENSKTNEKLKEATYKVADMIAKSLGNVLDLRPEYINKDIGRAAYVKIYENYYLELYKFENAKDGLYYKYLFTILINGHLNITELEAKSVGLRLYPLTIDLCHQFAKDIANGLLDRIAEMLEEKNKKSITAFETIEKEIPKEN